MFVPRHGLSRLMDDDREQERRTYHLCQMAFVALSFALVLATVDTVLALPQHFRAHPLLPWLFFSPPWGWVDTPIVWGSLFGAYLLWGRWKNPSWQRRTGLLLLMSMVDAALWAAHHGDALGLCKGEFGHRWFRDELGQALGWSEFALLASLSSDVLVHLGVDQAAETGRATRSMAATGASVFMMLFLVATNWRQGWPLEVRRMTLEMWFLDLGSTMIWTITLIQVTALSIAAARRCSAVVAEIAREDQADHLFPAPPEADWGLPGGAWGQE